MSFVVRSDFDVEPYALANLEKVANTFDAFITLQEAETLRKLLGQTFYSTLNDNSGASSGIWFNLISGADYTYGSVVKKWEGLQKMLKSKIYSEWLRETFVSHSGIGHVIGKAENSTVVNPSEKISFAFNDFVNKAHGQYSWEYIYGGIDYSISENEGNLYEFLEANKSDYPDYNFRFFERINQFSI